MSGFVLWDCMVWGCCSLFCTQELFWGLRFCGFERVVGLGDLVVGGFGLCGFEDTGP